MNESTTIIQNPTPDESVMTMQKTEPHECIMEPEAMNAATLRAVFETAREQELAHGIHGVRVVPLVSAILKAANELDEAYRLLKMSRQCLTVKYHPVECGRIDTFLERHSECDVD